MPERPSSESPHSDSSDYADTRYPGYAVLKKWSSVDWDEPTRAVVRSRIEDVPPLSFLSPAEAATLAAVCDRIVRQDHRAADGRVPIVPWIDNKLLLDLRDGYRYADLPPLREAWRAGLAGIEETSIALHSLAFTGLADAERDAVLRRISEGDPPGATWTRMPAKRFFRDVLCLTVVKVYYAHPAAWSEIGYSGPSSPRGHVRNWMGGIDPWDAQEDGSTRK